MKKAGWRLRLAWLLSRSGDLRGTAEQIGWLTNPRNSVNVPESLRPHLARLRAIEADLQAGRENQARDWLESLYAEVETQWTRDNPHTAHLR